MTKIFKLSDHPQRLREAALDELARCVPILKDEIEAKEFSPRAVAEELDHMRDVLNRAWPLTDCGD